MKNREIELIKIAKKGNVLVRFRFGGRKSRPSIVGKIVQLKDTTDVYVTIAIGRTFLVKSIPLPDSGQLYPIWYTEDLELVIARSAETREETIKYIKKLNEKFSFTIEPTYIILTVILLFFIGIDFFNGRKISV